MSCEEMGVKRINIGMKFIHEERFCTQQNPSKPHNQQAKLSPHETAVDNSQTDTQASFTTDI